MVQYISKSDDQNLAYIHHQGKSPCVVFCGGYRSDMQGTKAIYFENMCKEMGQSYLRFDYGGHGQSDGEFKNGTIGSWANDAIQIIDQVTKQDVILVGSSMGGWMALLIARARPDKVKAIIGIAAAPDFTEDIYNSLNDEQKSDLHEKGYASVPNDYSAEPYHYSESFYQEAKSHHVLNGTGIPDIPIHLVQGGEDKDVLPNTPERIRKALKTHTIDVTQIDDGDHRLSRPADLVTISSIIKDYIIESN